MPRTGPDTSKVAVDDRQSLEDLLNEIRADQAVFRLASQSLLLRVLNGRRQPATQQLSEMKDQVLRSIDRMQPDRTDREGGARWKRLASARAVQFFGELEDHFDRHGPRTSRR